jgi:hypothetical protein
MNNGKAEKLHYLSSGGGAILLHGERDGKR